MKLLDKIIPGRDAGYYGLLLFLPALIFGYYPLINLGTYAGVNLDISLLYVLSVIVVLLTAPTLLARSKELYTNIPLRLLLGFTALSTVSILWSENVVRGLITATFSWMLFIIVCTVVLQIKKLSKNRSRIQSLLLLALAAVALFSIWQIIGDSLGFSSAYTLLPQAYSGDVFGIARPIGFMLEPQFLGSLLIAPFAWITWKLLRSGEFCTRHALFAVAISSLLVLTISRGALLAAAVTLVTVLIASKASWITKSKTVALVALGFVLAFVGTYTFAGLRHSDTISGYQSVRSITQQLTLGIVTLPAETTTQPNTIRSKNNKLSAPQPSPSYVESSTSGRIATYEKAVDIWLSTPFTFVFGTGLGAFGAAVSTADPSAVVNNYYLEILSETGILGFGLFMSFLLVLGLTLYRTKQWLLLAILIGCIVQFNFFSGNANSIHVWVLFAIMIGVSTTTQKQTSTSVK